MNSDLVISRDEIDLVNTSTGELFQRTKYGTNGYFKVYPNPSKDQIEIECESNNPDVVSKINIYQANGTIIKELSTNKQRYQMDISDLAGGMYFLTILNNNKIFVDRIIKL